MAADNPPILPYLETAERQQENQGDDPAPKIESQGRDVIIERPTNNEISTPA